MLKFKQFVDIVIEGNVNESKGKFPDEVIGNDQIVFKKEWEKMNGGKLAAKYNQYYKGYDIDFGGHIFGSVEELERFMKDYVLSNNLYNKYKYMPEKPIGESVEFVNEGGNAVESRPMTQEEAVATFDYVAKKVLPLIGLDTDSAKPIGSFNKKLPDQLSGDLDIACSMDRIAGVNSIAIPDVLDFVEATMKRHGITVVKSIGFNQVSIGVPIAGKATNGIAQVDLMMTSSLDWSTFMYHSPDFKAAESKYKGMYRNVLLMSIVSECKKETTKLTDKGETQEYKQFVIRLGQGIFEVTKTLMGAKGLVKTAKLLHDQDKFVTNTPEAVTEIAFGPNVQPSDIMTFENIWKQFTDKNFIHKDKFDAILQRFKIYIVSSKVPVPTEVEHDFPNLFA